MHTILPESATEHQTISWVNPCLTWIAPRLKFAPMSALSIRFHRGGVHLPELGLWLDPHEPQRGDERVFVSHAHSDHIGAHREVILTEPTSRLMRARLRGERLEHVIELGRQTEFKYGKRSFSITLLPAGHVLGSAMALISSEGSSLLYTGDFKLRQSFSAELCDPRPADILIMETTFGRPGYRFPPTGDVLQSIIRFCRETLDSDAVPVLLAYSLGKSQEVLSGFKDSGLPLMVHPQIQKLTAIYEQFGYCFPPFEKLDPANARGKVILCPPSAFSSEALKDAGPIRSAVLTGWAADPSCRYRYRADAAFLLSDHADFSDLIDLARQVAPKTVYTMHGFAVEFAMTLREMGYDAYALGEQGQQLTLPLNQPAPHIETAGEQAIHAQSVATVGGDPGNAGKPGRADDSSNETKGRAPLPRRPDIRAAQRHSPTEKWAQNPDAKSNVEQNILETIEPAASFRAFADTCAKIGATSRKLEKTQILSLYVQIIAPSILGPVSSWFTGHPFAPSQNKPLRLGWAIVRDAVCGAVGINQSEFGEVYLKHSDLGETVAELLAQTSSENPELALEAVDTVLHQLFAARGSLGKLPILTQTLRKCTALEGKYLVKILSGELRIGLKEGLVEEAIAKAFGVPIDEVKTANLILGNIGETAQLAKRGKLQTATVTPFRPVKFMLASPEQTAESIRKRATGWEQRAQFQSSKNPVTGDDSKSTAPGSSMDGLTRLPTLWIEDKYDGIRCQLHKAGTRAALYSRDLKEMTATFLELVDAARMVPFDFVIDGEILAMRGGRALPFTELQRRLGRKEADLFLSHEVPVCYVAFDLLWFEGESLLDKPLAFRRKKLETLPQFEFSRITPATSVDEIEIAFEAAKERGNEGLVIKDPASCYSPGRRGISWLKLKKAIASLDCVVVGAEYGHGRRKSVLSDYTFAVRDETTGDLKTIGKSFTGLTDHEISELTRQFLKDVVSRDGRYLHVKPRIVLEIAFDSIQVSERHDSGLALRFPRIVRIRRDKSPVEIDTVASARGLLKSEGHGKRA
ncbi:MAG: ATP-dependent DNA ligase [Verrucomicrobia bacterium]|nr:ATP-dependent DNA ligase [Verrucomicrobiota bacterium]